MKSIKPGRAPSMMGTVGSIGAAVFGIIWTFSAISMGAPIFFALFGIVFVAMGIAQAVYHFKNATSSNRYSVYDITDDSEEPDPLNQQFGSSKNSISEVRSEGFDHGFCPYCGAAVQDSFLYCNKCGAKLPVQE